MPKKAIITGINGQDGAYLAQFLLSKDYEVFGLFRKHGTQNMWRLDELQIRDQVRLVDGDMADDRSLQETLKSIQPAEIYNLAAQSFVGISWQKPIETADINAMGTLRLLNAMKQHSPESRFYQASTSEMYGNSQPKSLLDESTPLHPRSPYAISKLFAHWMTINYRESFSLYACSGILFNHESPLRGIEFVTRKISDGVARIKLGLADHIALGNLDAKRDWGFAGDYVQAMWLMLQQEKPRDFVLSTGRTHSIRDFLDIAFQEVGIADWTPYVRQDPRYMRPNEVDELCGSSEQARKQLGWSPTVSFEELVKMMVTRDLERLSSPTR
jgi:GDPmannose 4,6-dehydratase